MKTTVTETRDYHQDKGETRMIEHGGRLFKVYYRLDHSYHSQSRGELEVWTDSGFKNVTYFNMFEQFKSSSVYNVNKITVDLELFKKSYEKHIKNFCKYLPKKEVIQE